MAGLKAIWRALSELGNAVSFRSEGTWEDWIIGKGSVFCPILIGLKSK